MRKALLFAAALGLAGALSAYRPYGQSARAKAAWMTVSSMKTGQEYYLEVDQDGKALMRAETQKSLLTRRGTVKTSLVKDFFREVENSEIINSQNTKQSKMVFYRGELLKISAYISGELTLTAAPLNDFGEAFSYAFGEIKKAAAAMPQETAMRALLRAEPVEGEELNTFRAKAARGEEPEVIETVDLQKIKPLMAAIKEPYRLIPIEDEAALKELQAFVTERQLYGLRTLFYVPSTRGTFKCQLLDVTRRQLRIPPEKRKNAPPARKPAER